MGMMKRVYTSQGKVKGATLVKEGVAAQPKPKPATEPPPTLFRLRDRVPPK